ncbi:B-cell receptor CD22-like [Anarhichas minor]|uniref:B-cell receptor CD22-like n=1 Tax=Anarhichas minor TaxID=65739 RepID=UPI003F736F58
MSAALTLLLVGSLLQGALCGKFKVSMPQTIEVLRGSCVTIPCSFEIKDQYKSNLDNTCRVMWMIDQRTVFDSSNPQTSSINGELRGDLRSKDCTTTLNNMQPDNSNNYFFRLECDNGLKWKFADKISISFTDDPPRPTLTPSALKVKEGTSVRLTCSAPAPCLSHPPTLTWTPDLGESVETLQENQDKTKVKTSVVTFTASKNHHGKTISCRASYNKQDGSTESAVSTSLTADISYSPKDTSVSVRPSGPVPEGSIVTLTCSSTANPAVKSYTWYRADGGQEALMGTGAVLNIKASKDDSPFFCKTENNIGAGRSNLSQIDVQYPIHPKDTTVSVRPSGPVPEGSIVTLTCSSTANPAVKSYTWYRADGGQETLMGTGAVLNIKASKDDSCFFCKADNNIGAGRSGIIHIDVQDSPKDTSVSVRPSGPVPEGSNVTLTCSSTANPAVKSYTWYRADGGQEAFMGTGAVLNIKASKDDSPFFCKTENIIGAGRSNLSQIDVQFAPQILSSSDCIKAADQLNCSCRTVGNPSPTLLWYLDGSPVNHSDKFVISNEPLNDTGLWSIITVNGPQERDLSTLLCRSSNSLGSATQRFCVNSLEAQTSSQGRVTSTFFIVTVGVLTAALICALLFAIRAQRTVCRNSTKSQCTGDTSSAVMSQGLTGETGNKAIITTEEDIYVNTNMMRKSNMPNTHLGHQQVACKSSEEKNEEGSDVVYSSVIWRSKSKMKKGERSGGRNPSAGSYLEEERCMEGGVSRNHVRNALEMESLYDKIVTGKDAKKTDPLQAYLDWLGKIYAEWDQTDPLKNADTPNSVLKGPLQAA